MLDCFYFLESTADKVIFDSVKQENKWQSLLFKQIHRELWFELTGIHFFIKLNLRQTKNRYNCLASCGGFTSKITLELEEEETTGHTRSKHICSESKGDSQRDQERERN